ncbi:MAG TPA: hypothetical protein VKC66_34680 [Xanthobacteraceae bacterium]|nr:hypothetical protein [Xanthobacteraceae bacterium]
MHYFDGLCSLSRCTCPQFGCDAGEEQAALEEPRPLPSIIEQIQRHALDHSVPISALLRRVKLAAAKLGLGAVEDWVDQELQGYTSDVPEYRVLQGQPMVRNPYSGWSPIGGSVKGLSKRGNGQSIAEIEHLLANAAKGMGFIFGIQIPYAAHLTRRTA